MSDKDLDEVRRQEKSSSAGIEGDQKVSTSIYKYITAHIKNGCLPENFHIPWINSIWAPGAEDGVSLYHMVLLTPDDERAEKIREAILLLGRDDQGDQTEAALAIMEKLDKKISLVRLYDEIIRSIANNKEKLILTKLLYSGIRLAIDGASLLSVKLGLTILSVFRIHEIPSIMMPLGACDEFTYFAARALSRKSFETGNQDLFFLAKNTYGWGRIHAVKYLRPETQEIKDWILYEGAKNQIDPQYSADTCLQKSEALHRLMDVEEVSEKEFKAIETLIHYTQEDGPCPGMTNDRLTAFYYLVCTKNFDADQELVWKMNRILEGKNVRKDKDP